MPNVPVHRRSSAFSVGFAQHDCYPRGIRLPGLPGMENENRDTLSALLQVRYGTMEAAPQVQDGIGR